MHCRTLLSLLLTVAVPGIASVPDKSSPRQATATSKPTIAVFSASPAKLITGQSSTLTWTVADATTLSVSGVGTVTGTWVKVVPAVTTTYTLTATNSLGSTTAFVTITVGDVPKISSFTAAATTLTAGQSTSLSWAVAGATTISINQGIGVVTGTSVTITPAASTTYSLTASNSFGSATAMTTVTVGKAPVIVSFVASPARLIAGQTGTLIWGVSGTATITIDQGIGKVAGTSVRVTPATTKTYTLTAANTFGSATATVTITVGSRPVITSFAATPAKIPKGQSSTLTWAVTGASTISINQGAGTVTGTSRTVTPTATTVYMLTATNTFGTVTATATVTVGTLPVIVSYSAGPPNINPGQSSTLTWGVNGATTLSLSPSIGTVTGSSRKVTPAATTTYVLTATNTYGTVTASVTVAVGNKPAISAFTATPALVIAGNPSALGWTVTGATSLAINQGLGTVTGSSVSVTPSTTTIYTLTATNPFGSSTATVTVTAGKPPTVTNFRGIPAMIAPGQSTTLSWTPTGSPAISISPAIGPVTGTSVKVSPTATTTYTITATNPFGSTTASTTVPVGTAPAITSFTASTAKVVAGQPVTLNWAVTGSPTVDLSISPSVGAVTGTSVTVNPLTTTAYTLTATNAFGTKTAQVIVTAGPTPTITSFTATPATVAPGQSATLSWSVTGQWGLSILPGIGTVATTSMKVTPTGTTTYTLTATNSFGSVTSTATVTVLISSFPIAKVTDQLYYTEHALFIIPTPSAVDWNAADTWDAVYASANINSYVNTLKTTFPSDYFFVVIAANSLTPNNVPNVLTYRHLADGIGENTITGVGVPNICRYNIGGGTVLNSAFGVLDHEIGHNWEVFIGSEVGSGHWLPNSTATGQMADTYSDDGYVTVKQISGDPINGFTWAAVDNITRNETETFSDQDLYLQGFAASFPDVYVLTSPVYNPDHTVSYSSVAKYDQTWLEQKDGVRYPSYQNSEKRLRMGFVYVARDLAEVQTVYQQIEHSANQFANAEQIDTTNYRFQVPFLVDTQYRASVDALLADLDGNTTPTLSIQGSTSLLSSDGTATVPFVAADADGPAPTVSCVPASPNCSIQGSSVALSGLSLGTHFFTIKAQDAGGKKTFAHFVVDVQ